MGRSYWGIIGIVACMVFAFPLAAQEQDTLEEIINGIDLEWPEEDLAEAERPEVVPITDEALDRLMDAYLANEDLQTVRPEPEPRELTPRSPRQRNGFFAAVGDFFAAIFRALGNVFSYVLAAIIIGAILYGLYLMFGDGLSLRRKEKTTKDGPDISEQPGFVPEAEAARALLEDADALAAKGLFAEAVHLLLFRSIDDIQDKQKTRVPKSLTAREIGGLSYLPDAIRVALSPIVRIVERSFFGGRPVDEAGWQEARASYETFAFGEAWA